VPNPLERLPDSYKEALLLIESTPHVTNSDWHYKEISFINPYSQIKYYLRQDICCWGASSSDWGIAGCVPYEDYGSNSISAYNNWIIKCSTP
jgi:hypothetical protein